MAKVVFQSTNARAFRATTIGYLYEIAKRHQVVLLAEEIDSYTKKLLEDKDLFPGLEQILFFESPFYGNIFYKNYRLCEKLKKIVRDYNPDIVIAYSDIWPAEMYLMRFAKKSGAVTIAIQAAFKIAEQKKLFLWSLLMNTHEKTPGFLPFSIRVFLVKAKKYAGYLLYHWILPVSSGELPFFGNTSFVFWDESSGLRDADYATVFSKRDANLYIKDGVNPEKLFVIGHPLEHASARKFFEKTYFSQNSGGEQSKILTLMWPDQKIGFGDGDCAVMPAEEMRQSRIHTVGLLAERLGDWKIFIKPHPSQKGVGEVKEYLGQIPDNVSVVDPSEQADTYIEMSSVIVGMPLPSTTLFTAQKQHPEKIIISLNLNNEFLGDSYKNFEGIEYIDSEEKLIRALELIRSGAYQKKASVAPTFDFADASELVDHLYAKRVS